MTPKETHRRILEAITRLQASPDRFVADHEIASALSLDLQEVQDHLTLMEKSGLVSVARTFGGFSGIPTAQGRIALKDPGYMHPANLSGDTFHMTGDFRGAVLNIKSTLTNVSQTISTTPYADQSLKDDLQRLIAQLQEVLQQTPADQVEEAEAVAETAKELVETATAQKPNKVRIRITAEGLKKAAENLATVMPQVLVIATQIVETVARFTSAGSVK